MDVQGTLVSLHEDFPGEGWLGLFNRFWPAYERWFLRQGASRRPGLADSRAALSLYMPELVPLWQHLVELVASELVLGTTGIERAARFLTLYRPTPYLTGCSQAVWVGDEPVLVRNYDYHPSLWEGVLVATRWSDHRVMAMSDCLWGVLDGMNEAGLAVSLSFGGRRVVGDGFGIPLVLRYLLERCGSVSEACRVLSRVPSHMAYNVTAVDAAGDFVTAYLAPDRPPILRKFPLCTNHQEIQDWREYLRATSSLEREQTLAALLANPCLEIEALVQAFRRPPLCSPNPAAGMGTLYTAVYYPRRGVARFLGPGWELWQSFARFQQGRVSPWPPLSPLSAPEVSADPHRLGVDPFEKPVKG